MIQSQRKAYAKVNLKLRITGLLENGYHLLDMINTEVSLSDTLYFSTQKENNYRCVIKTSKNFFTNPEKNTIYRAWKWYSEKTNIPISLEVYLTKKIPVGAGLGGGSSDAAQVLLFLHEVYRGMPDGIFLKESADIGADIPYFLHGGLCRVQGIGEIVKPLPVREDLEKLFCVVCFPKRRLSTKRVYAAYDELHKKPLSPLPHLNALPPENCLEEVSSMLEPRIAYVLESIKHTNPVYAGMSGSGSACFALYNNWEEQQTAKARLQKQRMKVWATKIIQRRQ